MKRSAIFSFKHFKCHKNKITFLLFWVSSQSRRAMPNTSLSVPAFTPVHCSTALQSSWPQLLFLQILIRQHKYFKILIHLQEKNCLDVFVKLHFQKSSLKVI